MRVLRNTIFIAAGIAGTFLTNTASAASIFGTFRFGGEVSVTGDTIDFLPAGGGTGDGTASATLSTGSFAVLNGNSFTIKDLTGGPVTGTVSPAITNFLSGFPASNLTFDLSYINPGVYAYDPSICNDNTVGMAGQSCTLPGSPFNLHNNGTGTDVSAEVDFGFAGTVRDTGTGDSSPFVGTLSETFAGMSFQQLLHDLNTIGHVDTNFSGTLVATTVPEPGTLTMLFTGIGMLGLSILAKRRIARS